jgi:hypothetical protein
MSFSGDAIGDIFGGITGASQAADAAESASATQVAASAAGIAEQQRQFNKLVELMAPYVTAGTGAIGRLAPYEQAGQEAFGQQQALIGLQGPEAERAAIERISSGETFQALARQGEEAMLQNASATGGLRGGNIQGALAQFRPALLSSLINQQYGRLGGISGAGFGVTSGLTSLGQASAAGQASSGMQLGQNVAGLLGQQGAATAGAQLAEGGVVGSTFGTLASLGGAAYGAGLFGGAPAGVVPGEFSLSGGAGQSVGGGGSGFRYTKF